MATTPEIASGGAASEPMAKAPSKSMKEEAAHMTMQLTKRSETEPQHRDHKIQG